MSSRCPDRALLALALTLFTAAAALAQEDIEPRTVGAAGRMTVGISGFADKLASSEDSFPLHATLHVDVSRFVTARFAARVGLVGSATVGGDEDETSDGPAASSMHALGSVLYYFSPQSMVSVYTGLEYRAQLTHRAGADAGSALGLAGIQAAVSSRAAVFVQGGYGARLTRGDEGELQTRIAGEIGFRLRF
jgi:hypothetical protein